MDLELVRWKRFAAPQREAERWMWWYGKVAVAAEE